MSRRTLAALLGSMGLAGAGVACTVDIEAGPGLVDVHVTTRDAGSRDDASPDAAQPEEDSGSTPDSGADEDAGGQQDAAVCGGADLSSDSSNCGTCGHGCLGGMCLLGKCQPVTLATGQTSAFRIAVDGANVYWTRNTASGAIGSVPIGGGNVTTVTTANSPRDLAVDGTNVYFTSNATSTPGGVWKVAKAGGTATQLVANIPGNSIAIDATTAYWSYNAGSSRKVGAVGLDGTGQRELVSTTIGTQPRGVAVDSTRVYYSTNSGTKTVESVLKNATAGTPTQIGTDANVALTADATHVFWVSTGGAVYQADKDGSNLHTLATINGANTIATDGVNVYVAAKAAGSLYSVPVGGGDLRTILDGPLNSPEGITVDANAVYIAENGSGNIVKVAK